MPTILKNALVSAAVYGLGLVCPVVPSFIWTALVNAVLSGDITPLHIADFIRSHNITLEDDFPSEVHTNGV